MKKILLLPGLGDVHWALLKLRSWLEKRGWGEVELSIWNMDARPRTLEYFDLVPWVSKGTYVHIPLAKERERFNSLYLTQGSKDSIDDFRYGTHKFHAVIGTNGNMRNGVPFSEIMEGATCDYEYGPRLPFTTYGRDRYALGPYFVLGFSGFGMFDRWLKHIPASQIQKLVLLLSKEFPDHRFIFTGCAWDREFTQACLSDQDHDEELVGDTSLVEFFSLVSHATGYLGWCGGNAILAQHLGTPTVAWWSRTYFPAHDRTGWETPHERPCHKVLEVEDFDLHPTVDRIIRFLEVARGSRA